MNFIANIMSGATGASGSKPNSADLSGKSGGHENSLFATLVSNSKIADTAATPQTDIESQETPALNTAVLPFETQGKSKAARGDEIAGREITGDKVAPDTTASLSAAVLKSDTDPASTALKAPAATPRSDTDPADTALKTPAATPKSDNDLANTAVNTKNNGLISSRKQTAANMQGLSGGPEMTATNRQDNPVSKVAAVKTGASIKQGGTDHPAEIASKTHIDLASLNGIITAKANIAKSAMAKPVTAINAALKTQNPATTAPVNSALAAFAKMDTAPTGKTVANLATAMMSGVDMSKPADSSASSLSFESTLNISAEKPHAFQTILQSHQAATKSGQLPINAVAIEIAHKFSAGANRFQIRLDPPELGRIDVRMDVSKEGQVSAHLIVEKPETLSALNRDAQALERALNNSGLETKENGLNFSLSGGNHSFEGEENTAQSHAKDNTDLLIAHETETLGGDNTLRGYITPTGVDIHV